MKLAPLLLALAARAWSAEPAFLYSATFAYEEYPKDLWPEELVRLKRMGFNTLDVAPGREVAELARLARRLGLRLWLDSPASPELEPWRSARGGPLIDVPPGRAARLSQAPDALLAVREAWSRGVKAVSCGEARPSEAATWSRNGALVRNFGRLLATLEPRPVRWRWGQPPRGRLPPGLRLAWLASPTARGPAFLSALNYNADRPITGGILSAPDPRTGRPITLRRLNLPPRQALLLPVNLPLAAPEVCPTCAGFAPDERLVSATAELLSIVFENGVLAMEFVAPAEGELVLELAHQPEGPLLAGARLQAFDWDQKARRLRLRIPPGAPPDFRSRVGLAIQLPDQSVFLKGPSRLIVGSTAIVTATFSSSELAARARLLAPAGWRIRPQSQEPTRIDYEIDVPADAFPGDTADLAIEAEGKVAQTLSLPLAAFCTVNIAPEESVRWRDASLPVRPHLAAVVLPGRAGYRIRLRNNSDEIRTFELSAAGSDLSFQPARTQAVVAGGLEREIDVQAWSAGAGLHRWTLTVQQGRHRLELPMALAVVAPGAVLAYQLDMDRDGSPDWVLENQAIRVTVSPRRGGGLLDFRLKGQNASGREQGTSLPLEARLIEPGCLELTGPGVVRRVRLGPADPFFEIEQSGGRAEWIFEGGGLRLEQTAGRIDAAAGHWKVRFAEGAERRLRIALEGAR